MTKLRLLSSSGKVVRRVWEAQWHSVFAEKCFVGDRHFVVWGWWCFGWIFFWLGMMIFCFFGWIFWLRMMIFCFFVGVFGWGWWFFCWRWLFLDENDVLVGDYVWCFSWGNWSFPQVWGWCVTFVQLFLEGRWLFLGRVGKIMSWTFESLFFESQPLEL